MNFKILTEFTLKVYTVNMRLLERFLEIKLESYTNNKNIIYQNKI